MFTADLASRIRGELGKVIVGQDEVIEQVLVCYFARGHALFEGLPGLAKTLLVKALARVVGKRFARIQFTPDLLPADVVGSYVFNQRDLTFELRPGPVFTDLLLADEINRTPPKTQSALLEVMEERQVTIDGETHPLSADFTVFATQNPLELGGTFPLPEAQLDRFMMKINIGYPSLDEEVEILSRYQQGFDASELDRVGLEQVAGDGELARVREEIAQVKVQPEVLRYMAELSVATRAQPGVEVGASPRASVHLFKASRALAAIRGMDYVTPDLVAELALPVMRHRIMLTPEAEVEGATPDQLLTEAVRSVEVPR